MVESEVKRTALSEGANAAMDKPIDIPRLIEIARDVALTGNCKATAAAVPAP